MTVQINLISKDTFVKMTSNERINFIINEVKQGKVLILEQGLTAQEQFELNKQTMSEIDHESFIGIEMPGFSTDFKKPSLMDRLLRRRRGPRMMAIGPAKLMRIIKKEPSLIQTIISPDAIEGITGEGIPIDDSELNTAPEAMPVDEDEDVSESQSRLEEFVPPSANGADTDRREELEMLIGPELRNNTETATENTGETQPAEAPEQVEEHDEGSDIEPGTGTGETRGYILRKLREEGEDE